MKISADLFEAFLKCSTKCWLRAAGEPGSGNAYADWIKSQAVSYRVTETERLVSEIPKDQYVVSPLLANLKSGKWRLALDVIAQASSPARAGNVSLPGAILGETPGEPAPGTVALQSCLDAIECVPSEGRGRPAQFIPIRFIFTIKLGEDEKLLAAFDAFVLSEMLEREVNPCSTSMWFQS